MKFKSALKKLHKAQTYQDWIKNNNSFLSYGFLMLDPSVKEEWQIGYYNPNTDKVTSFSIGNRIIKNPESDVFKKNKVLELDLNNVKVNYVKALEEAEKLQKKKYVAHVPVKKIILLQNLDIGQVWNITYITNTFKTLNIKIDSANANVLKYDLLDLFKIE